MAYKKWKVKDENFKNIEISDNYFWLEVGNKSIQIKADDEGVVVDIYETPKKDESFDEPVASTYAFWNE